jgi:hypothetical protein
MKKFYAVQRKIDGSYIDIRSHYGTYDVEKAKLFISIDDANRFIKGTYIIEVDNVSGKEVIRAYDTNSKIKREVTNLSKEELKVAKIDYVDDSTPYLQVVEIYQMCYTKEEYRKLKIQNVMAEEG